MSAGRTRLLFPLLVLAASLMPLPAKVLGLPRTLSAEVSIGSIAGTSLPRTSSFPIDYVGLSWTSGEAPDVRFRSAAGWGTWLRVEEEELARGERRFGRLMPGGDAEAFQVRGLVGALRVWVANTTDGPRDATWHEPSVLAQEAPPGALIPRTGWGANESLRFSNGTEKSPQAFFPVQKLIVHHTATGDGGADPAAAIRAIYEYHTTAQKFADIAYHFLIDRNGVVYKGRYSGPVGTTTADTTTGENELGYAVRGAHTLGGNSGTVGIAILGTHTVTPISPATRAALVRLLAWESRRHALDPRATTTYTNPSDSSTRVVPNISGHRDWTSTQCPGDTLYADLPALREETIALLNDTAPPAPGVIGGDAIREFQLRRRFEVSWSAADDHAATAFDVSVRTGRKGSFKPAVPWLLDSPAKSATFLGAPGVTYCFAAAASDPAGNQGPAGPETCTALAQDERRFKRVGDWTGGRARGAYLGTFLQASERGAALGARVTALRLSVVVQKCRGCGVLEIRFKGKRMKLVRLGKGSTGRAQLVHVRTFPQPRTGRLVLRVRSDGRPVSVEGVGIALA